MEKFKLALAERESKTPNQLRREGKIPATVYGPGAPSVSVQINEREFTRLPAAAYSHIIELDGAKEGSISVIIRNVQRKPTTHEVLNVEFYRIQAGRKLTVTVPLKIVGTSPAIQKGGQLIENYLEAEIECLPKDIPDFIEVDIARIEELDHGLYFSDLQVPDTIKILNPPDEIVVRVAAPRAAAAPAAAEPGTAPEAAPTAEGAAG